MRRIGFIKDHSRLRARRPLGTSRGGQLGFDSSLPLCACDEGSLLSPWWIACAALSAPVCV